MNKFFVLLFIFLTGTFCYASNFESTLKYPIRLAVINEIPSEQDVYEGEEIKFQILNTVKYKDITIKRGEIATAKIKLIITSGMNGIPASIVFDNFKIQNIPSSQLTDNVEVFGLDRSLWVFPLKWALTPFPPTGSLTNFIKGGHVKVKPNKVITIYYHPEWEG